MPATPEDKPTLPCGAESTQPRRAPFPWFGGKSRAAPLVWAALGDVAHYVEPFAGSLAVLLARPHPPGTETVNDIDGFICNFWRALQHAPDEVAHYANNPVNEADLTARHIWLVKTGRERIERLFADPGFYDAQVAGWWVWGLSSWIGAGWCSGRGAWTEQDGKLVRVRGADQADGVRRKLVQVAVPHLGDGGKGVNRHLIHLTSSGVGVDRQIVHLGNQGQGVNRSSIGKGASSAGVATGEAQLAAYLDRLAERLRYVRVCCGDWHRVVTNGALHVGQTVGIFLDPPYDVELRDPGLYGTDTDHGHVSAAVAQWCRENQDNSRYRIVLAGYEGEHDLPGWRVLKWKANRCMGRASGPTANSENRGLERLWLSPNCLRDAEWVQDELPLEEDGTEC